MFSEALLQVLTDFIQNPQVQAFYQANNMQIPTPEKLGEAMVQVAQKPMPLTVVQWDNRDHKEIPTPKEYYL